MKLHVGCGKRFLEGWVHVDIADYPHVDLKHDVAKLNEVYKGSVTELYASHVLEHFSRNEVQRVLNAWGECVAAQGRIWIAVPDFEAVVAQYSVSKNLKEVTGLLYGGQRDQYDYHKITFDFASLKAALELAGFQDVKRYNHNEFLPEGFDDWSRSYLPHMDFEHGRLMSLNVTAVKSAIKSV